MAWYWWLALVLAMLFVVGRLMSRREPRPRDTSELDTIFGPLRDEMRIREEEGSRALAMVLDLPMVRSAGAGDRQSREQVSVNVMKMARTRHVRMHVVPGAERVIFIQEIARQQPGSVVREFVRTDPATWIVTTRMAPSFQQGIGDAEAAAGRPVPS